MQFIDYIVSRVIGFGCCAIGVLLMLLGGSAITFVIGLVLLLFGMFKMGEADWDSETRVRVRH